MSNGLVDHDVGRLDVAVQLAGPMEGVDRAGELAERVAQAGFVVAAGGDTLLGVAELVDLAGTCGVVGEVLADHQLHREEAGAAVDHQVVESDEVGVLEIGERPELLLDAVDGPTSGDGTVLSATCSARSRSSTS